MKMRGQIELMIIVFLLIMFVPILLGWAFPLFGLIFKAYLAITIFLFVRNFLGTGVVSYVVAGVLIYIFIIKLWVLFASSYMLFLIVSMMLSGIIIFGLQKH
ncbi:hypothetical protein H0N95_02650 [Candidatus Micrarchaeota archaeon]|nr:hypothetical protein [Candidatus Micrarchaeota archaeon]